MHDQRSRKRLRAKIVIEDDGRGIEDIPPQRGRTTRQDDDGSAENTMVGGGCYPHSDGHARRHGFAHPVRGHSARCASDRHDPTL